MIEANINYIAVLLVSVASMVLGALWYSPVLFGKQWMHLMGINPKKIDAKKSSMAKLYFINFIAAIVMAYILSHFVDYVGATDIGSGIQLAIWVWLGFIATTMIGTVLWEGKPWKLYLINSGYQLVNLLIAASILAVWQ